MISCQRRTWVSVSSLTRRRTAAICCSGVRPSREPLGGALADFVLEPADAFHEEFVEVGGEDCEEFHALEERGAFVLGFVEDAGVEIKPG